MKNTAFCSSTLSALQQITSIFDFIWPTYTALWNLRWQVKGYTSIIESEGKKVTPDDLRRIFVTKKIHGENLKRLCENNWSVQENLFGQILLAYAFSIYEGWIAEIGDLLKWKKEQKDSLQFHKRDDGKMTIRSFVESWTEGLSPNDKLVRNIVYDKARKNKKYARDFLEDLLICYRCFKEARNSFIHSNGDITDRLKNEYTEYKANTAKIEKIMVEAPEFPPLARADKKFDLTLRGVVGLYNVIIFLIVTLDAELSNSHYAEKILLYRLKTNPFQKKQGKNQVRSIVSFFSENKIPFEKNKIETIIDPIIKKI